MSRESLPKVELPVVLKPAVAVAVPVTFKLVPLIAPALVMPAAPLPKTKPPTPAFNVTPLTDAPLRLVALVRLKVLALISESRVIGAAEPELRLANEPVLALNVPEPVILPTPDQVRYFLFSDYSQSHGEPKPAIRHVLIFGGFLAQHFA